LFSFRWLCPLGLILAVTVFAIAPASGLTWACETVQSGFNYGAGSSLELDGAGNPHISYLQITGAGCNNNACLRYANKSGTSWATMSVDPKVGTTTWKHATSLALDRSSNPRISYYNGTTRDLRYAGRGATWSLEVADGNNPYAGYKDRGLYSSIELDSAGNPHISYAHFDGGTNSLKYASRTGFVWTNETVPFASGTAPATMDTSLALDTSNRPHIASLNTSGVWYAYFNGASWSMVLVDNPGNVDYVSIALDSAGNPGISYYDVNQDMLKYAFRRGSTWTVENVSMGGGMYNSLAMDSAGNPRISYHSGTVSAGFLKYAWKTGSVWHTEYVDTSAANTGWCSSLEIDTSDRPHISYWEYTSGKLRYAVGSAAGADHVGIYRPSTHMFYLDYNGNGVWNGAVTDRRYTFGIAGDLPLSGDWNDDGKDEIGIYRPSTHMFYLDYNGNGAWNGAVTDRQYTFGIAGDVPVTGDWDRDGYIEIGIYRPSTHMFYLDYNGNGAWNGAVTDRQYTFGIAGDVPVTGDWNGNVDTEIGIYRPSTHMFYLDYNGNGAWNGAVTDRQYTFGIAGDVPVTGDWNDNLATEIGVFRPSTHLFYEDFNGNGEWNGAVVDRLYNFGIDSDMPVVGRW
jgi:hypothetical protein